MNSVRFKNYIVICLIILLSACTLQQTASPTSSTTPASVNPDAAPIDLAGPLMAVGSTFLYADGSVLVAVPGGPFSMGRGGPDNPVHTVNLSDFWIYSTKVTNGQYAYCVFTGLCTPPYKSDNPNVEDNLHVSDPIVGVDYDQAAAYCSFVHGRLPTEAEWEKTARGPKGNTYPWGDGAPSCDVLNYGVCQGTTTPVTKYPSGQSYYHAFDMAGNALEWTSDWYNPDYYLKSPSDNPLGPDKGREHSVRGSAFNSGGDQTPSATRSHSRPDMHRDNLSFRCVVDEPTYFAPSCETPATYGTDGIGGGPTGDQPVATCPDLKITQNATCNGPVSMTHISASPSSAYVFGCGYNPPGTHELICTVGQFAACNPCITKHTSKPLCPVGSSFDDTLQTCVTQTGGTGACLSGFSLDTIHSGQGLPGGQIATAAANQCCAFMPPKLTNPLPNQICVADVHSPQKQTCHYPYPSCPAGTTFDGQACLSVHYQSNCEIFGVYSAACASGGGGGGGGGSACTNTCGPGFALNPNTCQCDCTSC